MKNVKLMLVMLISSANLLGGLLEGVGEAVSNVGQATGDVVRGTTRVVGGVVADAGDVTADVVEGTADFADDIISMPEIDMQDEYLNEDDKGLYLEQEGIEEIK